jgi:PIN domain nuclease of toxin-antitoxin system
MLLDTHTLLWLTLSPRHLSKVASKAISKHLKENGAALVSAASFWEISVKIEKKKLDLKMTVSELLRDCRNSGQIQILDTTPEQWIKSSELEWQHTDPIDRLLVATASILKVPIITKDRDISRFYSQSLW